jgi:predicted DNA-binding transcriptional regulator YafY
MSEGILYRDITYLMAAGVPIEGEPGGGYRLSQPTNLPPEIAYRVAQLRQTLHTVRQNRIQGAEPQDACEPVPEEQSPQDHLERKTADSD